MIVDIISLKNGNEDIVEFDEIINFNHVDLSNTEIISISDAHVVGDISRCDDYFYLNVSVSGVMKLPCSITLKPVDFPYNINIDGNIEEMLEEMNEKFKKNENTIDIFPIIWENILMEIPMKVVSEEATDIKLEGNGWKLITEEEPKFSTEFEKLNDLFK